MKNNKFNRIAAFILSLAVLSSATGMLIFADDTAESPKTEESEPAAVTAVSNSEGTSKEETVYVISGADGAASKVIVSAHLSNPDGSDKISDISDLDGIFNVKGDEDYATADDGSLVWNAGGNDIYYQGTSEKELPVTMKISYKLDGADITPEDLAGKSGKLTMRFDYTNNRSKEVEIGGEKQTIFAPYAVLSGFIADNDSMKNISVTNGKLISDGERSAVIGYAVPGMQESLALDSEDFELPSYFEVSADVTDFELQTTVTVATGSLFADVNLDDIGSADELKDSISSLDDAAHKLIDGTSELYDGIKTLLDKSGELIDGVASLDDGAGKLSSGANDLSNGAFGLDNGAAQLKDGADTLSNGASDLSDGAVTAGDGIAQLKDGSSTLSSGANDLSNGASDLDSGVSTLKDGTDKLCGGASDLDDGAGKLKDGAATLAGGASELLGGATELKDGTAKLKDGATQLDDGATELGGGVSELSDGADELGAGIDELESGLGLLDEKSALLTGASKKVFETLLSTVTDQLAENKITLPTKLTIENYKTVLEAVKNSITQEQLQKIVTAKVLENVTAKVNAQKDTIEAGVTANIREHVVKPQVLAANGLDNDSYNKLDSEKKAKIDAAIDAAMKGDSAQLQIIKQTEKKIEDTITETMASDDVKAQIVAGMKQLSDALTAAIAQLDEYNTFYTGISDYTGGVTKAYGGAGQLSAGATKLKDGISNLSDGAKVLKNGTTELKGGANDLNDGVSKLHGGATELSTGASDLANGASDLKNGTATLKSGTSDLANGVNDLKDGSTKLKDGAATLAGGAGDLAGGISTLYDKFSDLVYGAGQLKDGASTLAGGLTTFKDGSSTLANGAATLASGANDLKNGTSQLASGSSALKDGVKQLADGAGELKDGMKKFYDEGIKKIVDLYNDDISGLIDRLKAIADMSEDESSFSGKADGMKSTVKYIWRTDAIKADTADDTEKAEDEQ